MNLPMWLKDARFAAGLALNRPFNCLIQVTNRCNLTCSFCDFWPNPALPSEELSVEEMQRLSEQLHQVGCFLVSLEGGEPFARKDLVDIVRVFSAHHLTALFTNGWYVTPENARAIWDAGLVHVSVSIDYADQAAHDAKRGMPGVSERAWRAVEILRDTAPRGGAQVNVMSVLMESTWQEMEPLFQRTQQLGVGHQVTLLSTEGTRRGKSDDRLPPQGVSAHMTTLFDRYRHVRFFRQYFERMDAFLEKREMPTCRAGLQSFNVDHVGNVSACIERIGTPVGNVRQKSIQELLDLLGGNAEQSQVAQCQKCWTACRGFQDAVGNRGTMANWRDMIQRTRTT